MSVPRDTPFLDLDAAREAEINPEAEKVWRKAQRKRRRRGQTPKMAVPKGRKGR